MKISNPGRNEVTVLFETTAKEEKIDVYYILDNQLTIKRSYYSNISNQKIKESVEISQAEEERLLKIVQKELEAFMERCIRLCMDSLPEKVASCSTQCRMNNWLC